MSVNKQMSRYISACHVNLRASASISAMEYESCPIRACICTGINYCITYVVSARFVISRAGGRMTHLNGYTYSANPRSKNPRMLWQYSRLNKFKASLYTINDQIVSVKFEHNHPPLYMYVGHCTCQLYEMAQVKPIDKLS